MSSPTVSVVIPVHNGGNDLGQCLQAISSSSWSDLECIIVDDASTDGMTAHTAGIAGARVLWLESQSGPAIARNRGVEESNGEIVFFIDADVLVHRDTLEKGVQVLRSDPEIAAVFGSYDDSPAHPSFISQYRNLYHHWVHQTSREQAMTFWTGCGAIRREVYREAGGFSESFNLPSIEDIEFGRRLHAEGRKVRLERTLQCKHLKQWTLWNVIKTDIFQRGIPWMLLLLASQDAPNDLNINYKSRLATVLAGLLVPLLLLLTVTGHATALVPTIALLAGSSACAWLAAKPQTNPLFALTVVIFPVILAFTISPLLPGLLPLMLIGGLVWTQWGFYGLSLKRHNLAFAFAVIPMQLVFFLCCAVSASAGIMIHLFGRNRALSAR
jgi:cellulose synthase/poly-beta-1,6-N-acetylglucosamine synthase-like glycosyltransferase